MDTNVKCSNCKTVFDWLKKPEVAMGYVKCPVCGYWVAQDDTAFKSSR